MVKNLLASAGDMSSISVLERSMEKKMATYSNILAQGIPRTEEPSGL